jgi:hypothetical protein
MIESPDLRAGWRRLVGKQGIETVRGEESEKIVQFSFLAGDMDARNMRKDRTKNLEAQEFRK